ncbi:hypothetical protein MARU1_003283 [Malassezia arunalokei]|uniref:ABC transporter domain-containing protein n=2 Tax=Malassezia TaxID=55193 RepID=A0AAJ5Z1K3_9BASI|nr:hypothetical protein MARU1_003283 [Malassezia arunalokei]
MYVDEPSNMLDLNAIAWLEDYLVKEWEGTLLVVSHDRAFLNQVSTDIVHMHSERLDYYKGNFDQFYETRDERRRNQLREYEANKQKREHLQAFIDRWRYNAARAAQAQSRIKELERLPVLEMPEKESGEHFTLPETDKISPPLLQLDNVTFGYSEDKILLRNVNFDVTLDSRIALIGSNGAGKSTLIKLLINQLSPLSGDAKRNPRLRIGYFSQHHIDQLDLTQSPVAFLASRFPGRMDCEKTSGPMSLQYTEIGWGTKYSNHTGLAKKGSESNAFLRIQDESSHEQFEFFECKSPPEGFETSPADAKYGQIRSAKDHSLCLTVQGIDNRPVYGYGDKEKGTKREYDRKNGYLTLEACSPHPRRQWWSDNISYVGMKKDYKRNHCSVDDDGRLLMYRNHAASMMPHDGDSFGGFLTWESQEE